MVSHSSAPACAHATVISHSSAPACVHSTDGFPFFDTSLRSFHRWFPILRHQPAFMPRLCHDFTALVMVPNFCRDSAASAAYPAVGLINLCLLCFHTEIVSNSPVSAANTLFEKILYHRKAGKVNNNLNLHNLPHFLHPLHLPNLARIRNSRKSLFFKSLLSLVFKDSRDFIFSIFSRLFEGKRQ